MPFPYSSLTLLCLATETTQENQSGRAVGGVLGDRVFFERSSTADNGSLGIVVSNAQTVYFEVESSKIRRNIQCDGEIVLVFQ
jgi:hypothetical protein